MTMNSLGPTATWCFGNDSPVRRVPGARAVPAAERWCADFSPSALFFALKSGNPETTLTLDDVKMWFSQGCQLPASLEDQAQCFDCPFRPKTTSHVEDQLS